MARMYRAGTAFVQIVPSFDNIQNDIARALRKDINKALKDKRVFGQIEDSVADTFASAFQKTREQVRKDIQGMVKDVDKEVTKGATTSVKNVKKVIDKEIGGGAFGDAVRKMGREIGESLPAESFNNLRKEYRNTRESIEKDVHLLTTAFTKAGERDSRNVERAYRRLKKNLEQLRSVEGSGMGLMGRRNVEGAASKVAEGYAKTIEGLSTKEINDLKQSHREVEAEAERHTAKMNATQERANAEARRIDNEERKRQAINEARDASRARERYRTMYETQYRQSRELAQVGAGGNRKQEKLTFKRDTSLDRYRKQIQGLVDDLSRLNNSQPHVRINTDGAYSDLQRVQGWLDKYEKRRPVAEIELAGDEQVATELEALRRHADQILKNIDFDIDVDDDRARAALEQFRIQAEQMRNIEVDVDVDLNRQNYNRIRAQLEALGKDTEDIKIRLNSDGVYDDVVAVDMALDSLRDKKVGVDITEREALAQIATVREAAERLDGKDIDIHVDVDKDSLADFGDSVDLARVKMRRLNRQIKDSTVTMAESTQAFRIFNPVLAAVAFVGAPAVSTLGGVVAGLGGIASFAPGAAAGLSPLLFAFAGLEDAVKKYDKAQEALAVPKEKLTAAQKDAIEKWEAEKDALGEATVAWVEYTRELKTQITEVQKGAREGLFPGLQSSIEMIMGRYAKPFTSFLKDTGEHLGDISNMWAQGLTTDEAAEWFARVGRDTEEYTTAMGIWVKNTVEGLGHLVDAFRPFAKEFSDWLINSSQRFADWSDSLVGADALLDFLESARNILPRVGDLTKNLGELFVNLTEAVEPFSLVILDALNDALDFINAMDPAVLGAILGAVGGLTGGLMLLSGVMAGIGALSGVLSAIGSSLFTQVAFGLGAFVAVSATALGATTALGSETGVLGDAMLGLGSHLDGAAQFSRDLFGLMGDLLDAFEPLIPVVADLAGDVLSLAFTLGGGLVDALSMVVDLIGWLIEGFSELPMWVQDATLVVGLFTLGFGKIKGAVDIGLAAVTGFFETVSLKGMYAKDALVKFGGAATDAFDAISFSTRGAYQMEGALGVVDNSTRKAKQGLMGLKSSATQAWGALDAGTKTVVAIAAIAAALAAMKAASDAVNLKPAVQEIDEFEAAIKGMEKSSEAATANLNKLFSPEGGEGSLGSWAETSWLGTAAGDVNDVASAMELMGTKVGGVDEKMSEFNSEVNTLFGLFGDTQWDAVRKQLDGADEALSNMATTDFEAAANGYRNLAKAAEEGGVPQSTLNEYMDDYQKSLEQTANYLGIAGLKQEDYTAWMAGEVPPAVQAAADAEDIHAGKLAGVADETQRAADEAERLVDKTERMQNAFDQSMDSAAAVEEAMGVLEEALATGEISLDLNTEAGKKNVQAIRDIRDEGLKKAENDALVKKSTEGMSDALWGNYKALVDTLEQMTGNREEAHKLANKYYQIPDDVRTQADFDNAYANKQVAVTKGEIDELDDKEAKPTVKADTSKANSELDETKGFMQWLKENSSVTLSVWAKIKEWGSGAWDWTKGLFGHDGFVLEPYAQGGLRPMDPIAQMVKPNTWRVVGDRMDVDEAYIPLNGSKRSWSILTEALARMPGPVQFHDGGIAQFAAGAVASAAPAAPAKATEDAEGTVDSSAITEAMAALVAAMGDSWSTLLTDMLAQTSTFYGELLAVVAVQNTAVLSAHQAHTAAVRAAYQAHYSTLASMLASHNSGESSRTSSHLEAMASRHSSWRSTEQSRTSSFLSTLLSTYQSGNSSIRSHWSDHFSSMSSTSTDFRTREANRFNSFLNSTMIGHIDSFGRTANNKWSNIWSDLVSSATRIFGQLPPAVGNILSSTSGKMNTHIVTPYNKVVSDLDLSKSLKISPFPTASYATGGRLPGYTPGRDVHQFYSPTGGIINLSGGEGIARPEVIDVLGEDWLDGANLAARTGGQRAVQKFLGGFADGGRIPEFGVQSFAKGGKVEGIRKDTKGIVQLGKLLQSMGVRVSEHPAFGSVGGHSPNSWHYRAGAIDLNTAPGTSAKEMRDFDRIMPLLYKLGWGVIWRYPNHYGHAHVDIGNRSLGSFNRNPKTEGDLWEQLLKMRVGPATGGGGSMDMPYDIAGDMDGFLSKARKAVGSGALPELMMGVGDKVFSALAKEKADEFVETVAFAGGYNAAGSGSGPARAQGKSWADANGLSKREWQAMDFIISRESSWNPKAKNPSSTAAGLPQFIAANQRHYGVWPIVNQPVDKQLSAFMRYVNDRFGGVVNAESYWRRHNHYADGTSRLEIPEADLNPEVLFRDGGGPLPTGYSIVQNNLGHEETILPKTVAEVSRTFERLEQVTSGDGAAVQIADSVFRGDPRETAEEIARSQRIYRNSRPVKF